MKAIHFSSRIKAVIMRNIFLLSLILTSFACTPDDQIRLENPYLTNVSFQLNINLDLPEYNRLNFPGNSFSTYNHGINGVVIYNLNNVQFTAFELSDPNHLLRNCSRLNVQGVIATCGCGDGNSYNILTGELMEGSGQYPLKAYRVNKIGNKIEVFN